nr:MAG TPA: hypothetical protein [Caudoviricetes sp.]
MLIFARFPRQGGAAAPPHRVEKRGKEMNRHGQVAPAYPAYLYVYRPRTPQTKIFLFFSFSLLTYHALRGSI